MERGSKVEISSTFFIQEKQNKITKKTDTYFVTQHQFLIKQTLLFCCNSKNNN